MQTLEDLAAPNFYHRDGTPIIDNELFPAAMQWALLFEQSADRLVGNTTTLYGERLSTVWLGMNHNYGRGRPLLFETMLFAPKQPRRFSNEYMQRMLGELRAFSAGRSQEWEAENPKTEDLKMEEEERAEREAYIKKHFPHDQMQLRYSTENEAADSHERLAMQCLIPPRWRHFLLWTVGRQEAWRHWDDDDDED